MFLKLQLDCCCCCYCDRMLPVSEDGLKVAMAAHVTFCLLSA